MFTIDIILGTLKKLVSFLWEYKFIILTAVIITVLYLRGNNYKQDYETEAVAHVKTVLEYNQQINDIRIANEQALRIAQEESAANYKELVEKTQGIQEKYNERNKDINATITKLNSSNNSLQQTISEYTKRNSNPSSSESVSDSTSTYRLQLAGELLEQCIGRKQYYAYEADRLNNSVLTLQEWGNMVIENSKQSTSKGDKGGSKIFDNIVDVGIYLGVPVAIPSDIPDDCNVLCYSETTGETPCFYKECGNSLYYIDTLIGETWKNSRTSLEKEVDWDKCYGYKLAYLRLATKDNSDVLTPERLLGVETDKGFIIGVLVSNAFAYYIKPSYYVYTTESLSKEDLCDVHNIKFFILDDSDETVSFEEYVNKFYDGGINEAKFTR